MDNTNWLKPQMPKLKNNWSAAALQANSQSDNIFAPLTNAVLGIRAQKIDNENAQKMAEYNQQKEMAERLLNYGREDQVAQRERNWQLKDRKDLWGREDQVYDRNSQHALEDRLLNYDREDAVARRERNWQLQDRNDQWEREDNKLAEQLLNQPYAGNGQVNKTADALDKYAHEKVMDNAAKKLTLEDFQKFANDPTQQIVKRGWYNPLGLLGKRHYLKQAPKTQFSGMSDEELTQGL